MDKAHKDVDKALAALERRIVETYSEAQKELEGKLAEFTRKFEAKDRVLQMKLDRGEITADRYSRWLDGQVFQGEQWQSKLDQITKTLTNADQVAQKLINGQIYGVFANNANYQLYGLCMQAGLDFGFELYDPATVARLLRDNPEILPRYKLNIPKDKRWNRSLITRQITQGIIQGEPLQKIAKRMERVTDQDKNLSLTRARTAMTGAQNAGRQESLNQADRMGVKTRKEWLATLDGHTRTQHARLDGQSVDIDKPFQIDGYTIAYPGDPHAHPAMVYNCRCTMIGDLVGYPNKYDEDVQRYDNIDGKPIKNMTYREWLKAKKDQEGVEVNPIQVSIGASKTVEDVNAVLNGHGWFKLHESWTSKYTGRVYPEKQSVADLSGCDLECAKSIAASYERVFEKYPQLVGKLDAPNAHPVNMGSNTYAWCYIRNDGEVQVNPKKFSNYNLLTASYEQDVRLGWHPVGTTAESIVVHELGHAVDGLLVREGIAGGVNAAGEYRYASSLMRNKVMKKCGYTIKDVGHTVSDYAAVNPQEWFAECFAEYITSASPRPVAAAFGEQLEELLKEMK